MAKNNIDKILAKASEDPNTLRLIEIGVSVDNLEKEKSRLKTNKEKLDRKERNAKIASINTQLTELRVEKENIKKGKVAEPKAEPITEVKPNKIEAPNNTADEAVVVRDNQPVILTEPAEDKEWELKALQTMSEVGKTREDAIDMHEFSMANINKVFPYNKVPTIEPTKVEGNEKAAKLNELKELRKQEDIKAIKLGKEMGQSKEDIEKRGISRELVDQIYDEKEEEPGKPQELEPLSLGNEMTPEEKKVNEARELYIDEYSKCRKEFKNMIKIDRVKNAVLNIFRSRANKVRIREEDYLTQECKDAKEAYDKARVEKGKVMSTEKRIELEARGLTGDDLEQALKEYRATEILDEIIIKERQKIIEAKAGGVPINPALWKKLISGYMSIRPRWKRVALSTVLFLTPAIAGAVGAASVTAIATVGGLAAVKFGRSMAMGTVVAFAMKGMDRWDRKRNKEFYEYMQGERKHITRKFSGDDISLESLEQFEQEAGEFDEYEKKHNRNMKLLKMGMGVCLGGLMSLGVHALEGDHSGQADSIKTPKEIPGVKTDSADWFHKQPGVPQDSIVDKPVEDTIATEPTIPSADTAIVSDTNTTPEQTNVTPPETPDTDALSGDKIVAEVGKGHGAIKTIEEFQEKLKAQYQDPTQAPASVQHILNTKADRLAIEYGMFKPGDDAESAIMKLGSKFESDADGNISFTQEGKTTLLEKGDDADVTNVYGGKMIDGDNSGRPSIVSEPRTSGTSKFLEENPQRDPVGTVNETTPKVNDGTSEFLKNNPQKDPAGSIETEKTPAGVKPVTEPAEGITKPKIEEVKSNLTAGRIEDISPTKNVFDNSYGTNTETISPTRGVYNTGAGSSTSPNFASNREVVGNGFTTENPMTNEALAEREFTAKENLRASETTPASNNTGNVIENQSPKQVSINQDPRHADSLEQARERFGRSNIEIEKPEGDYTNGIKHENWNKASDNMFKAKNVKFDSFESYEKEDELQRLLGSAKQEVKYVQSIDKNAEVVTMDYFREQPEWKTIEKIPAKYFLDNFDDVKFADGTPVPQADIDKLVSKGIIRENVNVTPGQATTTSYSFKNQTELERLSKTYGEILSKEDIALGNDKPIGNENLEKYVARMTKRVYTADDGTMFAPKEKFVPSTQPTSTTSQGYETMRADRVTRSSNYNNSNTGVISPTRGVYQTRSDYSLANRATENIIRRIFR